MPLGLLQAAPDQEIEAVELRVAFPEALPGNFHVLDRKGKGPEVVDTDHDDREVGLEGIEQLGTPLINLTEVFAPICPELECPTYLLPDNHHPNSRGYRLIAETVTRHLRDLTL